MDTSKLRQSGRIILLGAIVTGLVGMSLDAAGVEPTTVTLLTILTGIVTVHAIESNRKSRVMEVGLEALLAIPSWLESLALRLETAFSTMRLGGIGRLRVGEEFFLPKDGVAYLSTVEYFPTADNKEAWFHFFLHGRERTIIMDEARAREEGVRSILPTKYVPRLLSTGARTPVRDRYFEKEFRKQFRNASYGLLSLETVPHDPEGILAALAARHRAIAMGYLDLTPEPRHSGEEPFDALFTAFAEEIAHALGVPVQEASLQLRTAIEDLSSSVREKAAS